MRLNGPKNLLLLAGVFLLPLETSALAAQADNEFNASSTTPVTLNFNTTGNWQQGGPGSWDPNNVGNIDFPCVAASKQRRGSCDDVNAAWAS